jgi:hypothetical protein
LPYTINVHTEQVNKDEPQQIVELTALLRARRAVIVYAGIDRTYLPTLAQLRAAMPLMTTETGPDGTILTMSTFGR